MKQIERKVLVVLSGGQDSVTVLGMALQRYKEVVAISFRYNQRHQIELESAADICQRYKVPHRIVELDLLLAGLVNSALTDATAGDSDTSQPHPDKPSLPASFVPGRNALFLTLAHAYAQTIGAQEIHAGFCQTDFSGYPDCRDNFVRTMQDALNIGYETGIHISTPLMYLDKATTFLNAVSCDFLGEVLEHSHTCYNGDRDHRHEWGYGCGECPACKLRAAGWEKFAKNHPDLVVPKTPPAL